MEQKNSDAYQADASAPALSETVNLPSEWLPIETAPKDGTKIDLLYPYPRGRTVNCLWAQNDLAYLKFGWIWRTPIWKDGVLLPEDQWNVNCYGGEPTHWMPVPALPDDWVNFSNEAERDPVSLKSDTSLKDSEA